MAAAAAVLTEATQQEMQKQLEELAVKHKKAKLQELFSKRDELQQAEDEGSHKAESPRNTTRSNEEIEAMKSQFNSMTKKQLDKQISAQFLLRIKVNDKVNDKEDISDESGEIKVNDKDEADMRAEFDKYQKKLLSTQIEKSFRLRTPHPPRKLKILKKIVCNEAESQEMESRYNEMNKMMVRLRSTKTIEMGIANPQIKPKHKKAFNALLADIGIVNQTIVDSLWQSVENIVNQNQNQNETIIEEAEAEEEEGSGSGSDSFKTDNEFDDMLIVN